MGSIYYEVTGTIQRAAFCGGWLCAGMDGERGFDGMGIEDAAFVTSSEYRA